MTDRPTPLPQPKPTNVTVASPRQRIMLPLPYARVTSGSVIVHVAYGLTRWHALGRAAKWAQAHGADGSLRVSRWLRDTELPREGSTR